jgi:hypothetical protein
MAGFYTGLRPLVERGNNPAALLRQIKLEIPRQARIVGAVGQNQRLKI